MTQFKLIQVTWAVAQAVAVLSLIGCGGGATDTNAVNTATQEDAERVRNAVAALPDEHRQVIELRFFADAKLDDIATALDIPLGSLRCLSSAL